MSEVFAKNYRGFKDLRMPLDKTVFLVGDNSTGKSSIMYLLDYVVNSELDSDPSLETDSIADKYDFFSPYFDNADVTIGFKTKEGNENVSKVITIKKSQEFDPPKIVRFSIFKGDKGITLKRNSKNISIRFKDIKFDLSKTELIYELHENNLNFTSIGIGIGKRQLNNIRTIVDAIKAFDEKKKKDYTTQYIKILLENFLGGFRLISPLRANPSAYYNYNNKIDNKGAHFAAMLYDIYNSPDSKKKSLSLGLINSYGKDSGLFNEIEIEKISKKLDSPPLVVTINRNEKYFSITQVGFGVSQSLPIVVEVSYAYSFSNNVNFGLQQPELHLHPRAQASMGEFIFNCSDKKVHLIVETHSDFIIDRFKSLQKLAQKKVNSEIMFLESSSSGNLIHNIPIDNNGEISNAPESYRDFFIQEYIRTI